MVLGSPLRYFQQYTATDFPVLVPSMCTPGSRSLVTITSVTFETNTTNLSQAARDCICFSDLATRDIWGYYISETLEQCQKLKRDLVFMGASQYRSLRTFDVLIWRCLNVAKSLDKEKDNQESTKLYKSADIGVQKGNLEATKSYTRAKTSGFKTTIKKPLNHASVLRHRGSERKPRSHQIIRKTTKKPLYHKSMQIHRDSERQPRSH